MSQSEFDKCVLRFYDLYECGLVAQPDHAVIKTFFDEHWLPLVQKGYDAPSGYDILATVFHMISGGFEYPECGPDIEEIKVVLESLSNISLGKFMPQNIQIGLDNTNEFYAIIFEYRDRQFRFKCFADPDFVPETEIVAEINRILETTELQERFIGITPPSSTETAGYVFAAPASVREATKRGLIWSSV